MTDRLKVYKDVDQRSDEWHALRCGMVTASSVGKLLTPSLKVADNDTSRGYVAQLVAERITGRTEEIPTSFDMFRGIEHEPYAREHYATYYAPAPVTEVGYMVRTFEDGTRLGLSPDGVVGEDGLLEVKCPRSKGHLLTILADAVPAYYMAQCQAALLVSGRAWLDFVSFHGGLPLFVKRVEPDAEWFAAIREAVAAFETKAADMVAAYTQATEGLSPTERVPDYADVELKL